MMKVVKVARVSFKADTITIQRPTCEAKRLEVVRTIKPLGMGSG